MNIDNSIRELIIRGLASYYGMTLKEFNEVINGSETKFARFYYDFLYNHN